MANISILIITYNRPNDTLALLENLKNQSNITQHVGEILLLNNNSDDSYEICEKFISTHPELPIRYIDHDENIGVARGRNFLIERAQFPYLLVLDDDVVFEASDAIEKCSAIFQQPIFKENNTAIVTLNIFYYATNTRQANAFPHKKIDKYKSKDVFLTYFFIGAAHLMKKEIFSKTGLYPTNFFYGMEEYDLSFRTIQHGYTLGYDDSVKVLHKESPLGRIPSEKKSSMIWYNKCVVAYHHLPKRYFYSIAIMWAFQYLRETKGNIRGMLKTIRKITTIPKNTERNVIGKKALKYLKMVEARLWY